jgi:hypothetical protein
MVVVEGFLVRSTDLENRQLFPASQAHSSACLLSSNCRCSMPTTIQVPLNVLFIKKPKPSTIPYR